MQLGFSILLEYGYGLFIAMSKNEYGFKVELRIEPVLNSD